MNRIQPAKFKDVFDHETTNEIPKRRDIAGFKAISREGPGGANGEVVAGKDQARATDLVGIALSGGGLRSASFNLGVLQAFYRRGVLRHADYLSTVSGGTYTGSYFSYLLSKLPAGKSVNWNPETKAPEDTRACLAFHPEPSGQQSESVRRLIHGGMYLRRPLTFVDRYLVGLIWINATVISGLLAVTAAAAWLFRCLDHRPMLHVASTLGFQGDLLRAFLPSSLLLVAWLIVWFTCCLTSVPLRFVRVPERWRSLCGRGHLTRALCLLLIVSALMGFAAVLQTGDLSLKKLAVHWDFRPDAALVASVSRDVKVLLGALFVISLLPYLRLNDLIRSGTRPTNAVEGWIFAIASRALLFGLPLIVFGLMAQEDISGWNKTQPDRDKLTIASIADWPGLLERVRNESASAVREKDNTDWSAFGPSEWIWAEIGSALPQGVAEHRIAACQKVLKEADDYDANPTWWSWYNYLRYRFAGNPEFLRELQHRFLVDEHRYEIVLAINQRCLADPLFYRCFEGITHDSPVLTPEQRDEIVQLRARAAQLAHSSADGRSILNVNRALLGTYYGDLIRSPSTVLAYSVLQADQQMRVRLCLFFGIVFVCLALPSLNLTSMHGFYRDMLSRLWLGEATHDVAAYPMAKLATTDRGGPYHLINASLNLFASSQEAEKEPTTRFLFSKEYCGSDRTGYRRTTGVNSARYDLTDAMAISGAALTPKIVDNPLLVALLFLSNSRLGRWLPNPGWARAFLWPSLVIVAIGKAFRRPEKQPYFLVTDGGHHENLGIEELLARRCRLIIASDASQDGEYEFSDLVKLIRRMRVNYGVRITGVHSEKLDLQPLVRRGDRKLASAHYRVARIFYPECLERELGPSEGILVYMKPTLTGTEPVDLTQYCCDNPQFPHDPTLDQFYDPRRFECYRQLGYHTADTVWTELFSDLNLGSHDLTLSQWSPVIGIREPVPPRPEVAVPDPEFLDDELIGNLTAETVPRLIELLRASEHPALCRKAATRLWDGLEGEPDTVKQQVKELLLDTLNGRDKHQLDVDVQHVLFDILDDHFLADERVQMLFSQTVEDRNQPKSIRRAARRSFERIRPPSSVVANGAPRSESANRLAVARRYWASRSGARRFQL